LDTTGRVVAAKACYLDPWREVNSMSETHRKTIEAIYAAIGRGDLPFILQHVSDSTRWDFAVGDSKVPWYRPASSKLELPGFFQIVAEHMAFEAFEPRTFVSDSRHVVVKVGIAYTVKRTGRRVDQEQVHWWTFDEAGRIAGLRHYEDTAAVRDACQ
jgi:ketosteroid isomerase-like protein